MPDVKCGLCVVFIDTTECIECFGICGRSFHLSCLHKDNSNYKKQILEYLRKISNLQWYCDNCYALSLNGISKSFIDCANELKHVLPHIIAPSSETFSVNASSQSQPRTELVVNAHFDEQFSASGTGSHEINTAYDMQIGEEI